MTSEPDKHNDDPHGDYRALAMAVGHTIVQWALIESQLDNWAILIFHDCGGKALAEKGALPREYKRKATFLRQCFRDLAPLEPFKLEGLSLLDKTPGLARIRHNLVHGTLEDMNLIDGVFRFRITETKLDHRKVGRFDFDPFTFPALEKEYSDVVGRAGVLAHQLIDHFRRER